MSVQLILYPQNYEGFYNVIGNPATEFIVNGNNFNNLNSSPTYTAPTGYPLADSMQNAPPVIPNQWYRWRSYLDSPDFATNVAGNMVLDWNTASGTSGVYQRMTNLIIGQQYNLTINYIPETDSTLFASLTAVIIEGTDATAINSQASGGTQSQPLSLTFTAASISETLFLSINSGGIAYPDTSVTITSISVQPAVSIPTLSDGQVIVDLYEDEDLPLTLSVDEFKNVAEKVQSYSKAFNLPATKRNNRIFDHIFEITRSYDGLIFNPYKRTQCVLKQDGFILFEGYLRMLDITDKEGEISYNVNLYSEVIALADTLKDRAFRDLDFTELEHDYNYTNIVLSETGDLALTNPLPVGSFAGAAGATITNVVRYPFVDWNHNYSVTSGGMTKLLTLESSFRPFISIKYIIDRIFEASEFTYSSTFFDTTEFEKLYMDFNWGADNAPVVFDSSGELTNATDVGLGTTYITIPFDEMDSPFVGGNPLDANFGYSLGVFTALEDGQVYTFNYDMQFNRSILADTLFVQWLVNGIPVDVATSTATFFTYSGSFTTPPLSAGDTVLCQAYSTLGLYELDGVLDILGTTPSLVTITTTSDQTTNDTLLGTLRGELGQWDFLKGLITMFNLITLVDEDNPNNIIIEPYSDVFIPTTTGGTTLANRGIEHDWTDKIDVSEMKLTPLTDLNRKTIFKFVEDDDDYSFNQYKNLIGGHLYGSKKFNAGNEFNILDGLDEVIAEPFAATVVKPLMSQFPEFITPAIYARGGDGVWEGFENSPRIMYNNGVETLSSTTYSVPAQNGVAGDAFVDKFLQFSHYKFGGTSLSAYRDFHFGECQLLTNQVSTPNNLFNLYWLPYYNELYNPNTRIMTIKVNLNPSDINLFKFNDTVFIKNRTFRVNKINYKPNDLATVEFILIP